MSLNLPVSELTLERGDSGLGFNIRGGIDIPHVPGDSGIFVTRLKEDGAAFKDGRLKEGDKILEVNGKNIERVTHNEAVQIFITAGNTVRMKVQHGAYAELMKNMQPKQADDNKNVKLIVLALSILAVAGLGAFILHRQQAEA
ncbi:synaptojanin-2-binding protein-like [Babylonia areolata]|uniref:synaptojanin-2-binding protein-like n=1 Tax=Babylonia areolata TaxID=304850 RepID=UPI003FCF0AA7